MAEGEIVIMFQPQVDIGSGAITGVEALTRWLHPRLGTLSAETVLQVAERAEIFPLLSGHIWEKTLQIAHQWPRSLQHLRLSVTIGETELAAEDLERTFESEGGRGGDRGGRRCRSR